MCKLCEFFDIPVAVAVLLSVILAPSSSYVCKYSYVRSVVIQYQVIVYVYMDADYAVLLIVQNADARNRNDQLSLV